MAPHENKTTLMLIDMVIILLPLDRSITFFVYAPESHGSPASNRMTGRTNLFV
jgi:hypothetical protein